MLWAVKRKIMFDSGCDDGDIDQLKELGMLDDEDFDCDDLDDEDKEYYTKMGYNCP